MKSISRSILELIWNGLMVDVESILAPFGINVGSILEAISASKYWLVDGLLWSHGFSMLNCFQSMFATRALWNLIALGDTKKGIVDDSALGGLS